MSNRKGVVNVKNQNPKYNASGCKDLTAYEALRNIEAERAAEARYRKLLAVIFSICELSGFHLEERIVLKDKKSGKVWR